MYGTYVTKDKGKKLSNLPKVMQIVTEELGLEFSPVEPTQ